jgi:hypothetical protein
VVIVVSGRVTQISRKVGAISASALVVGALGLLPSMAAAQSLDPGAPSVGSPPANQYEIPVQAGRHDAAPPRSQRGGGGGGGSLYRSDNNFGSSSVVPGDPGSSGGGGASGGAGGTGGGGGTGAAAAGVAAASVGAAANRNALDTGSPSTGAAFTTLPLIIALGIVIGIAGVRMRRRSDL